MVFLRSGWEDVPWEFGFWGNLCCILCIEMVSHRSVLSRAIVVYLLLQSSCCRSHNYMVSHPNEQFLDELITLLIEWSLFHILDRRMAFPWCALSHDILVHRGWSMPFDMCCKCELFPQCGNFGGSSDCWKFEMLCHRSCKCMACLQCVSFGQIFFAI